MCNVEVTSTFPRFLMKNDNRIIAIKFNDNNIASIIKFLGPKKVHRFHNISIHMIKLCQNSVILALKSDLTEYFSIFSLATNVYMIYVTLVFFIQLYLSFSHFFSSQYKYFSIFSLATNVFMIYFTLVFFIQLYLSF